MSALTLIGVRVIKMVSASVPAASMANPVAPVSALRLTPSRSILVGAVQAAAGVVQYSNRIEPTLPAVGIVK